VRHTLDIRSTLVATDGANLYTRRAIAPAGGKTAENAIAADFFAARCATESSSAAAAPACVSLSISQVRNKGRNNFLSYSRESLFWHGGCGARGKRGRGGNARALGRLLLGGLPTSNIPAPGVRAGGQSAPPSLNPLAPWSI
jgi:hypothetical protein